MSSYLLCVLTFDGESMDTTTSKPSVIVSVITIQFSCLLGYVVDRQAVEARLVRLRRFIYEYQIQNFYITVSFVYICFITKYRCE